MGSSTTTLQTERHLWIRESNHVCLVGEIRHCDYVRVMVDAGWKGIDNVGVGWVALSGTGERWFYADRRIRVESPSQAEGLGVRMVLLWAREQGIRHLEISTDCFSLVGQLAGIERPHHLLKAVLEDILSYLPFFHCLAISYIPRSFNNVAHRLACKAMAS
ncbi:uncharacterized protein LOC141588564 [Silene latifolia]|uniref:uncharacterized protein LOC141588564 n=1 Tax=Silene latifolia TaxID=37657 RepID=UPI003D778E2B